MKPDRDPANPAIPDVPGVPAIPDVPGVPVTPAPPARPIAPVVPVVPVAVRLLAEAIHRQGGLAGPAYAGVSGPTGTRLHQQLFRRLREQHGSSAVLSEVALSGEYALASLLLKVSGRCDALIREAAGPCLVEAKSFAGSAANLPDQGEPLHWAQVMLYGHLYLLDHPAPTLRLGLFYLSSETDAVVEWHKTVTAPDLANFYERTCQAYARLAGNLIASRQLRDVSARQCPFPYPSLRAGQKRFMQAVIGTIRQKGSLFVQAPTGTGKTMSVLYPAVKALAHRLTDHVFYLTAMTSTRVVAERALDDLRASGLYLRSLTLQAKEKICLEPDLYCDTRLCPLAIHYYDHLPAAMNQLLALSQVRAADLVAAAREHRVCPFELSLDLALYCDVIIGDYNYAFDPRVQLERFFAQPDQTHLLLVDEAHNLPARSREMYSATVEESILLQAAASLAGRQPLLESLVQQALTYCQILRRGLAESQGFGPAEKKGASSQGSLTGENFAANREKPEQLLSLLGRLVYFCRLFLDDFPDFPEKKQVLDLLLMAHFFGRVADEFYGPAYITTAQVVDDQLVVTLMCLDAAAHLTRIYGERHPVVFFSATLSPLSYYVGLLDSQAAQSPPEQLVLASPFPAENLLVISYTSLSTRYQDRTATLQPILELILAAIRQRVGNYLVFVPSFAYLSQLRQLLRARRGTDSLAGIDCLLQVPNMTEIQKHQYLGRFEAFGQRTLLAVAVVGSLFNEGIDLGGERLTGVVIVGVGLPQICPEREIMRQYYANSLGSGFEYAYQFPGFNKVQQAAGRVIRSEEDCGFVLLIDDRYKRPEYGQLFPLEWHPVQLETPDAVARTIHDFWAGFAG